jgi:hypothetical protein
MIVPALKRWAIVSIEPPLQRFGVPRGYSESVREQATWVLAVVKERLELWNGRAGFLFFGDL